MESPQQQCTVTVIGGGLVGTLQAIFLAKHGYQVQLYEKRKDPRINQQTGGRSINLSLSVRGQEALKVVGLEDVVLAKSVKLFGRMVHLPGKGRTISSMYGLDDQCHHALKRQFLIETLLNEAERYDNIKLNFSHELISIDFHCKLLTLSTENKTRKEIKMGDFCFGCDGINSAVRAQIHKCNGLDYEQTYIKHGYKELTIPQNASKNTFVMKENYLHIWPWEEFMLIAIP